MAQLLVTGGAGFIGSHLTDRLVAEGHEVTIIDDLSLGNKKFINKKARFKKMSIVDYKKIVPFFHGVEAVFHLAADPRLQVSIENPTATHAVNVAGTLNVLQAAKMAGVKKVIFSSSCAVYGDQALPFAEVALPVPKSPYGLQKLMGEEYCRLFYALYGIETVCLRYFNVFGSRKLAGGSYPMVIPLFLRQHQMGENLTIVGDGESTRDYVHVRDVVEANIKAWQSPVVNGQPINVGSGRQISVNTIAKLIGGETINLPERPGEMRAVEADISRAKKLLGWDPGVSFEVGLAELKAKAGE